MADEPDAETSLKLYKLIVSRYRDTISKSEDRSVSEIRQRVSPYDDYVKELRDKLTADLQPYHYDRHFFSAVQKVLAHIREIKTFRFPVTFWMDFREIGDAGAAGVMDKAILLAALLRSLDSKDVKVMVTKSGKTYVGFAWGNENYAVMPESGSLLAGEEVSKVFSEDPLSYAFSDLFYESYEEE